MVSNRSKLLLRALVVLVCLVPTLAFSQTKLLRFPDIHGDKVVFCHAGDLWVASADGGTAVRLTTHPGQELFPKFSPDGNWVAFTGQYDGDEQVYIIPTDGGVPKQLTYYPARGPLPPRWGFDNQVYGWTIDGTAVLFRSMRYGWDLTDTRLYTVSVKGGLPEPLPMPVSGGGDFSPDGTKAVYSPLVRDFRTWKRYRAAGRRTSTHSISAPTKPPRSPITIVRTVTRCGSATRSISHRIATEHSISMSFDLETEETTQLTKEKKYDLRWPSADAAGNIVYELAGELQIYDTAAAKSKKILIRVPNDGVAMRPSRVSAAGNIENWGLSPKGERAVFAARGDIFTAPIEKGATRNLTRSSNAHDKWPAWSPDGKQIAFISDRTGEEELYLVNQDGKGELVQLTKNGKEMRYLPKWSPDGKKIAFTDKNGKIWVLDVASKKMKEIADEKANWTFDYTWSPNGGFMAIALEDEVGFGSIYIWSAKDNKLHRITGPSFNEWNPVWDPKGDYLYYLSDREFAPQIGSIEWNYMVDRETYIYALALRKDVKNPFPFESDEVKIEEEKKDEDKDKKKDDADKKDTDDEDKKDEKKEPIKIDFEGLAQRVARIPVDADNYYGLAAIEGNIIYVRGRPFYYGRGSDVKPEIKIFTMEDREEDTVVKDAGSTRSRMTVKSFSRARAAPSSSMTPKPNPATPKRYRQKDSSSTASPPMNGR